MRNLRIAIVTGSLRKDSINALLAQNLVELAPEKIEFCHAEIGDLPLYNQDDDSAQSDAVRRFKSEIAGADGVLFVTPEYNRSVPGVLKNAIDHASRPYGDSAWSGKPAGVIGISVGALGTAMAQQHLRNILAFLDMPTLAQPEAFLQATPAFFDDEGNIGPSSREFVKGWVHEFTDWVARHSD